MSRERAPKKPKAPKIPLAAPLPKRFVLKRVKDETGTSGTGEVASGVVFSNGQAIICWSSIVHSLGIYQSIADLERIHGHEGNTKVEFLD